MSQSTEEIEAKLAAFVDGELDAAGKAEIEKHLVANPQHRKLLEDLTQHRDLMRALPREKAPPEILESLQSHLERRLLLEESPEIAGRIGPSVWRQFMSVAAVLALVGTLGILIYSVVPSSDVGSSELAHLEKSTPRTTDASSPAGETDVRIAAAKPTDDRTTVAVADMATRAAVDALQPTAPPASIGATGPLAMGGAPEPRLDRPTTDTPITLDREIAPSGAPPVVVLVADDTATAEREVAAVLTSNSVNFEHVTPAAMSRTIPTRDEIAEAFARRESSTTLPVTMDSAIAADRDAAGASRDSSATAPGAVANLAIANAGPMKESSRGETMFLARNLSPAQRQAVSDAFLNRAQLKQEQASPDVQQQYQAYAAARFNVLNDSALYSKDKLGSEQKSDFGEMAKKLSIPTSQLAGMLITSGEQLEIEIPQSQARARQLQKATVSPEGTIALPDLPEVAQVPAAGRTLEDYQSAVNEKLRAAAKEEQVVITRSPAELTDMLIVVRGGGVAEAPAESAPANTAAPAMPSTAPATTNPATNPN